jgi:hypothetical protein
VTRAAALLAVLALLSVLAACGGHKPSAYAAANTALLNRVPVYAGAVAPQTSASASGSTEFGARDWTLPAKARATIVIDWYIQKLQPTGWKVTGKSFNTIRAARGTASLSVGVRARTLEVVANSRGVLAPG